VNVP
jgi:hypothetical protein